MKNSIKILFSLLLLVLAAAIIHATGNVLVGLVSASMLAVAANVSPNVTNGVANCLAITGLKRQCQTLTIGGAKRLYIALTEDIETEFLTYELAKSAGKFTGAIPLIDGKKFFEIEAWYDTTKFDTEMKIGAGFTQGLEFKVLGYNAAIVQLAALLYETPVNVIVQGNDDQLYYIGMKYIPMMFEMKGSLPEKGTARKEVTFTAKQDGMMVPAFPLDSTVTFAVEALAGAEAPEGGA